MHLLIPFAAADFPQGRPVLRLQDLPHLRALLGSLAPGPVESGPDVDPVMPHERFKARLLGISSDVPGCIPWTAQDLAQGGREPGDAAWAWISPVHLVVGAAHISLVNPGRLELREKESRELLEAMAPYFAQDGIHLEYQLPGRWLAHGPVFDGLACASLDRASGQDIQPWMPRVPQLRRLQNEMQMLLYTHPVNDVRQARGAVPVNSFWIHGSGKLVRGATTLPAAAIAEVTALREAALQEDTTAWQQAWTHTDSAECRALRETLGDPAQLTMLTLCGTRNCVTFGPKRRSLMQRMQAAMRPVSLAQILDAL